MTKRVFTIFKQGGILVTLVGLLLGIGGNVFASNEKQVEWVVVQGTACVDANRDATCSPNEVAVSSVVVRSDGVALATTDATGRFSIRVPAQSVIEFEVPAGHETASDNLRTQVFESGRLDVPLTKIAAPTVAAALPTATIVLPTSTARPSPTLRPTQPNTPTPKPTLTPEPSATFRPTASASPFPPAPSVETPAPTTEAAATTLATATASATATALPAPTETATTSAAIAFNKAASNDVSVPAPTEPPAPSATPVAPVNSVSSFEDQAQPAARFSPGAIPGIYVFSGVGLVILALLLGWLVYRANAVKTNAFAPASVAGGFAPQLVVWEQGAGQSSAPVASRAEWHPLAQRLIDQSRLKSIAIDAQSGIVAANNVPAPIFVLSGQDGNRLVFTIDPSLPVRSGLVADRSQIMGIAALRGNSRNDAHALWGHVARTRNLPHVAYPTWADWYLVVC